MFFEVAQMTFPILATQLLYFPGSDSEAQLKESEALLEKAELEEVELEVLRLEGLPLNLLLPKNALEEVGLRLEEVELEVLRLEGLPLNLLLPKNALEEVGLRLEDVALWLEPYGIWQLWEQVWQRAEQVRQRLEQVRQRLEQVRQRLEQVRQPIEQVRQPIEQVLQRIIVIRFPSFLAMLWQKLLESLLFSGNVSEFPNKRRPPCTTMPWNIRPALIVLWGVCWMFYPGSPIDEIQLQLLSAGEQTLFSNSDIENALTGQYRFQHSVSSNDLGWDFLGRESPDWHFSGPPENGNLQRLHLESLVPLPAPNTQLVLNAEVAPFQDVLAAPDTFSFPHQQVSVSIPSGQYVEPGLMNSSEALSGSLTDQLAISLPGTTIKTFEGVGRTLPIDQQAAIIAKGDQRKGHAQLPAPSAIVGSAGWIEQTADLPHKSTTYKRFEEPPRNSEGKMICEYNECSNFSFTRRCDWNKHMDKHTRPYICKVDGCDHPQGFTSKGVLSRHQCIVHKLDSGESSLLFCDEPNCERGPSGGPDASFSRKDNLAEHTRRRHGQSSTASSSVLRVDIANDTTLPDVRLESLRSVDKEHVTSLQRKRRRISGMGLSSQNADRRDGEETFLRSELTKMTQRVEELSKELKEVHKKYEEKTETLVGIIKQLAQQS